MAQEQDAGAAIQARIDAFRALLATDPAGALALIDALAAEHPRNHWLRVRAALLVADMGRPAEAWDRVGRITQSDTLVPALIDHARARLTRALEQPGPAPHWIDRPADHTRSLPGRRYRPGLPSLSAERNFPSGFPGLIRFAISPVARKRPVGQAGQGRWRLLDGKVCHILYVKGGSPWAP